MTYLIAGNACLGPLTGTEYQMFLVYPNSLEVLMAPSNMPPALAPAPALSTVSEPPLPPVTDTSGPGIEWIPVSKTLIYFASLCKPS